MRIPAIAVGVLIVITGARPAAEDWTQWRGPARDGSINEAVAPPPSAAAVKRAWAVPVGEGYSSPVVAGSRVFAHSRLDPEEVVTAVDLQSGRVLWQQKYQATFAKNQYAARMAKGPNATPLVAGDTLYTLGVTGVLAAWNIADGTLRWRKDYSSSVDTSKLFCGTAASPLLEDGALIVQVGSDVHGGRILALDPATGQERWVWQGPGPGYASPLAITAGGVRQIVTMTNGSAVGLDAKTGKTLWTIAFPDEWHENIVTPVWTGNQLIISGVRQGTHAYALTMKAGVWQPTQLWKNTEVTMYMSAPVAADGLLYGLSNKRKGQFIALDLSNGSVRWATEGREGDHASVLLTPAHVMFVTNAGHLVLARRNTPTFTEDRRLELAASETWAAPVPIAGGLVIRDAQHLARLQWSN
jgi:outer membrane protein assembly factor BamB